jgi:hypothetical protein
MADASPAISRSIWGLAANEVQEAGCRHIKRRFFALWGGLAKAFNCEIVEAFIVPDP